MEPSPLQVEIQKLDDLLANGFIQEEECQQRKSALIARFEALKLESATIAQNPSNANPQSSTLAKPSTDLSVASPASLPVLAQSPPAPEHAYEFFFFPLHLAVFLLHGFLHFSANQYPESMKVMRSTFTEF
jgi:hypothetical protein